MDILFLFDVDGTLTEARSEITEEMVKELSKLRKKVRIGFVGGSNLEKQEEQVPDILNKFDYGFPENGISFYKNNKLVSSLSFIEFITEKKYNILVNKIMEIFSKINLPFKRGTFIEHRDSMINIAPCGRQVDKNKRKEFNELDKRENIRKSIVNELKPLFPELSFSIGGQISIDVFPKGWDKTYCLNHIKESKIIFFGDMTHEGGNDYEIFNHERVEGVKVNNPLDTIKKINMKLKEYKIE